MIQGGTGQPGGCRHPLRLAEILVVFLGFLLLTIGHQWPLSIDLSGHYSTGRDYFQNSWNLWWVRDAAERGVPFYDCDMLFHPGGTSLAFHTITFATTIPALLLYDWLGQTATHNLLFLSNFVLSGLACYFLLRHVVGCRPAAFLGGVFYTFNPYHATLITQLNNSGFQWLPLFLLCLILLYERGRWFHAAWAGIWLALAGYADWYQPILASLVGGLFLVCALTRDRRWADGRLWLRILAMGAIAGALMAPGALPLIREMGVQGESLEVGVRYEGEVQLFGVRPTGSHFFHFWPTLLGYLTVGWLAALALRWREGRARFWWWLTAASFLFALGPRPVIFGHIIEWLPLPMALFPHIPILSLIRVPRRFLLPLALGVAGLLGFAQQRVVGRFEAGPKRWLAGAVIPLLFLLELMPAHRVEAAIDLPAIYGDMAEDPRDYAVLELPLDFRNGYGMWLQTVHGKPLVGGYTSHIAPAAVDDLQTPLWRALMPIDEPSDMPFLPEHSPLDVASLTAAELAEFRREFDARGVGVVVFHHDVDGGLPTREPPVAVDLAQKLRIGLLPFCLNPWANDAEGWHRLGVQRVAQRKARHSIQARELLDRLLGPPTAQEWVAGDRTRGLRAETWDLRP